MTSQAGAPGAAAVYLYREQVTDDSLRMYSFYERVKVLTEGGKSHANVEIPFVTSRLGISIDSISGRTIHPDGTIVPFSGKPYDKLIEKFQGFQEKAKVFTLPSVEVGSILEYRYKLHYDDSFFSSPDWFVQSDLYVRKAHYVWRPTTEYVLTDSEGTTSSVAWTPILPAGAKVVQRELHDGRQATGSGTTPLEVSLDVQDIPPLVHEDFMPPMDSISYRVLFYYTSFRSPAEYWKSAGKRWSKERDKFIGPGKGVKEFVNQTVSPSDTEEQKLKKLYDDVMKLENTDFTRVRTIREEKAQGFKEVSTADDVLQRKRGSSDQLAELFVSMVRAAGMKGYVMGVANRDKRIFLESYLSLGQLDDYIAIVNVDGKDVFFDPGERYCEFKHLAWIHTASGGLRQTESGTVLEGTPSESYKAAHVTRIADLSLDEHGEATGKVTVTYTGDPALSWRQEALRGDDTSLNTALRSNMEHLLPGGMEVRVNDVQNLADTDKPLTVEYAIKGSVGSPTGKRLLIQADLLEANEKPTFPEAKREVPVYFHYPSFYQDAVRIKYPASLAVEAAPQPEQDKLENVAMFTANFKQVPGSITSFRNVQIGKALYGLSEYPQLRAFYTKMENKDQEPLILIHAPAATASVAAPAEAAAGK